MYKELVYVPIDIPICATLFMYVLVLNYKPLLNFYWILFSESFDNIMSLLDNSLYVVAHVVYEYSYIFKLIIIQK